MDELGNPLGMKVIEAKSGEEAESLAQVAESAEQRTEALAEQTEEVLDHLNTPPAMEYPGLDPESSITVYPDVRGEQAPPADKPTDIETSPTEPAIETPVTAKPPAEPEKITPIDPPKPPEKPKYRHRWGRR